LENSTKYGGSKIMGMSASQMRYVMISGEKSDVEFQGQQINQQRTTLATETSALNSQLLDIAVPTPPSTDNFTTTNYTFTDSSGTASSITGTQSTGNGLYTVNYTQNLIETQGQTAGFVKCGSPSAGTYTINGTPVTLADTSNVETQNDINYLLEDCNIPKYSANSGTATQINYTPVITDSSKTGYSQNNVDYLKNVLAGNGQAYDSTKNYYSYKVGSQTYYAEGTALEAKAGSLASPSATTATGYTLADITKAYDATTNPAGTNGQYLNKTQFYQYTYNGKTTYATDASLKLNANASETNKTYLYNVNDNASVTESSSLKNCKITWSSTGRMSAIDQLDTDNKTVLSSFKLGASTTNDNTAYQDAYSEYEYQKQQYQNKMDGINAKMDIVQSNDKKLELKLQDLDTKQKALDTEMESVKKVIQKNVETSFKTFA